MSEGMKTVVIDYFTDLLCVWAWVAKKRNDELMSEFGDNILFRYRYMDVFGDVDTKIQTRWADRGLYQGFADHVKSSAAAYGCEPVNSDVWDCVRPKSSMTSHLVLKAIEITCGIQAAADFANALRHAFFVDGKDVGRFDVLYSLAGENNIDVSLVEKAINEGGAGASLMGDYQEASRLGLKGSPSYILNEGRQTLYGNVGYRVLKANVVELLRSPKNGASWC